MADNLGPMAWLFLPENVQVQYLQKIALRAENPSGPRYNSEKGRKDEKDENDTGTSNYFLHEVHIFCCPLKAAHFPAKSPLLERETRPFSQE